MGKPTIELEKDLVYLMARRLWYIPAWRGRIAEEFPKLDAYLTDYENRCRPTLREFITTLLVCMAMAGACWLIVHLVFIFGLTGSTSGAIPDKPEHVAIMTVFTAILFGLPIGIMLGLKSRERPEHGDDDEG